MELATGAEVRTRDGRGSLRRAGPCTPCREAPRGKRESRKAVAGKEESRTFNTRSHVLDSDMQQRSLLPTTHPSHHVPRHEDGGEGRRDVRLVAWRPARVTAWTLCVTPKQQTLPPLRIELRTYCLFAPAT